MLKAGVSARGTRVAACVAKAPRRDAFIHTLIEHGANPNGLYADGPYSTSWLTECVSTHDIQLVRLLLTLGSDPRVCLIEAADDLVFALPNDEASERAMNACLDARHLARRCWLLALV
jgi:hypothetical protein